MNHQTVEELKTIFEESFKQINSRAEAEIKKYGQATQETKEHLDRIQDRMDELETQFNRPALSTEGKGIAQSFEEKAFINYMRKGEKGLTAEEFKALSTDSDPDGGYMVPTTRNNNIIQKLIEFSPIRQLANVVTITGNAYEVPAEGDQNFAAGWVGERSSRDETDAGQLRLERIPVHEIYAKPKATQTMIDDAAFNLEQWIDNRIGTRFGVMEGTAFVSGNGVTQPEGLLTHTGISAVAGGDASSVTSDGFINTYYDLPSSYAMNGTWIMKRSTIREVRKLKTSDDQYLWQPGLAGVAPATILDRPYIEVIDMPEVAADAYAVIFGDIRAAYTIVDRQGIRMLRDPYSSKPFVEFYTTKRVGGQVVLAEALRKMKIATTV